MKTDDSTTMKNSLSLLCKATLRREYKLTLARLGDLINPILFFALAASLFPLSISPHPDLLTRIAPGVIWVIILLALIMGLDNFFRSDFNDGSLELQVISPHPLSLIVLIRIISFWVISILPLILVAGLFALMLNLPLIALPALFVGLILGTLSMYLIGSIAAALTVGVRNSGVLLSLLVMPLYIPVLIFATGSVQNAIHLLPYDTQLLLLAAITVFSLTLAPVACATALKIALN